MCSKLVLVLVLLLALEMTSASFIPEALHLSKQINRARDVPELNRLRDRLLTLVNTKNLSARDAQFAIMLKEAFEYRLAELTPAATTTVVPAAVITTSRPAKISFVAPVSTAVATVQPVKTSAVSSAPLTSLAPTTTTVAPTTTAMPSTTTTTTAATATTTALTTTTTATALKSTKAMRASLPVTVSSLHFAHNKPVHTESLVTDTSRPLRIPDSVISTTHLPVAVKQNPNVDNSGSSSRLHVQSISPRPSAPSPSSLVGNQIEVPRAITFPAAPADRISNTKLNAQNGAGANVIFWYWYIGVLTFVIVVLATLGFGLLYKRKLQSDALTRADIIKVRNFLNVFEPERFARLAKEGAAAQTLKQPIARPSRYANSEDVVSPSLDCTPREVARLSLEDIVSSYHGEIYGTNPFLSPTDTQTTSSQKSWVFKRPPVTVIETAL